MSIVPIVKVLQGHTLIDSEVTVHGWVRTRRDSKAGISFLAIYDGSCLNTLQAVIYNTLPNYNNEVLRLTTGCSVRITGSILKSIGSKQHVEIQVTKIVVLGWVEDPNTYPVSAKHHSVEYLREMAHLRPRTNIIGAVARVRHTLAQAIHRFLNERGFFWVSTPVITTCNTEGTGEMFHVSNLNFANIPLTSDGKVNYNQDFFSQEAFLTVSGQLHSETYACAISKIYTFGPTFRAEKSNTSRHLAEFWMVEPEVAFADMDNIVVLAENMLKYVIKAVLEERNDDMHFFSEHIDKNVITKLERFLKAKFNQIDYTEAVKILQNCGKKFASNIYWGEDLLSEHEHYLTEQYFKAPVVVTNYPKDIKAFYMRMNEDGKTVAALDILAPGIGEIIGGSQREERLAYLDKRLDDMGFKKENYWWYRDLRRYGTVPHSGFGLGFERLIVYITGIKNIRDVIPYPRSQRNANF